MSKKKAFAFAFSCLLGFAVACSNQGEGERCNSDDDCGTNLTCVSRATFADTSTRVCCPTGDTSSSNQFCNVNDPGTTNPDASGPIADPDASAESDADTDATSSSSSGGSSSGGSSSGGSSSGGDTDASTDAGSDADAS